MNERRRLRNDSIIRYGFRKKSAKLPVAAEPDLG
jgi:hypothetical protein